MPLTYHMSNLAHELFFVHRFPDFSVVAHPYPRRHELTEMDKRELSV